MNSEESINRRAFEVLLRLNAKILKKAEKSKSTFEKSILLEVSNLVMSEAVKHLENSGEE